MEHAQGKCNLHAQLLRSAGCVLSYLVVWNENTWKHDRIIANGYNPVDIHGPGFRLQTDLRMPYGPLGSGFATHKDYCYTLSSLIALIFTRAATEGTLHASFDDVDDSDVI